MLSSASGEDVPDAARSGGWLGFPPATEGEILAAEARLKIALPPSFKGFLRVSNGWLWTTHAIDRVRGVKRVEWFRKENRRWISAYTKPASFEPRERLPDADYFAYGKFGQEFEPAHLKESLQISEIGDSAVYLLNPQVIGKDGEWEAWFLASWLPGVRRYRSFEEMMRTEYTQFSGDQWRPHEGVVGELPDEYVGSPGSPKRKVKKRARPRVRKILGKPYDKWSFEELMEMLRNPEFGIIHGEVIEGLGLLGDPRAIEPLIEFVDTGDNRAASALYALKSLAPDQLSGLLLRSLARPDDGSHYAAASLMAELKDIRAVPLLVQMMRDTSNQAAYQAGQFGPWIAQFGQVGFDALVDLVRDGDPTIRLRAVNAICSTGRPEARDLIAPLLADPDPTVRERATLFFDFLPYPKIPNQSRGGGVAQKKG